MAASVDTTDDALRVLIVGRLVRTQLNAGLEFRLLALSGASVTTMDTFMGDVCADSPG